MIAPALTRTLSRRYDQVAGLLYRRPSYEALGQNELSKVSWTTTMERERA